MRDYLSSRRLARAAILRALEGCTAGKANADELDAAIALVEALPGTGSQNDVQRPFCAALRGLSFGVRWQPAILSADPNPERFRDAARAHAAQAEGVDEGHTPPEVVSALRMLRDLSASDALGQIAELLLAVPIPISFTNSQKPAVPSVGNSSKSGRAPVLVLLKLDGQPVPAQALVSAQRAYDLTVEARTGRWPDEAERLRVAFLTQLGPADVTISSVEFGAGDDSKTVPFVLRVTRQAPQRPLDIAVQAGFKMSDGSKQPARVLGYPHIWLSTFDSSTALPRGMPTTSRRLVEMLSEFDQKLPSPAGTSRDDWYSLMECLMRYASHVSQKGLLLEQTRRSARIAERRFHRDVETFLRADPNIGGRLGDGSLGGGITDLRLGDIVLELKVENDTPVDVEHCSRYLGQPSQYAAGADVQVSILCVLDNSPKNEPPGILANEATWMYPRLHGLDDPAYPSMVSVLVVPVGFPRPSAWSRG